MLFFSTSSALLIFRCYFSTVRTSSNKDAVIQEANIRHGNVKIYWMLTCVYSSSDLELESYYLFYLLYLRCGMGAYGKSGLSQSYKTDNIRVKALIA